MKTTKHHTNLVIALLVAFTDYMGVGLIYPLFSSMLFDTNLPLLPLETPPEMRGFWLGILIALMPLASFFSAPLWGAISDNKGRKKPLQASILLALGGYLIALLAVLFSNLPLLLLSRLIIGAAAGNMSIIQATIADISTVQEKMKNFSLYAMALGAGFTLGPFFGGGLGAWNYSYPFIFTTIVTALNLLFVFTLFQETHTPTSCKPLHWKIGFTHLKKAFRLKGVQLILLCSFLHQYAWSYFFEFAPIYLISRFQFTTLLLGLFYGAAGGFYVLSTGCLARPFMKLFLPETLFFGGNFFTALTILGILLIPSSSWLWPLMFLNQFFLAFVTPNSITIMSNHADDKIQGEALGVLSSVNAFALVLSPLCSGLFVGKQPTLALWVGGLVMLLAALLGFFNYGKRLLRKN